VSAPTWLQAIVLGVVQGLTEFIPISSSGHLVLVPYALGWERPGLAFDVALHVGTAGAIITYFRSELWAMARGFLRPGADPDGLLYRRLGLLLALATIPVAVVGLAFKDAFEAVFANPPMAAGFLFGTAGILFAGEAWRSRRVRRAADRPTVEAERPGHAPTSPDAPPGSAAVASALPTGDDPEDPDGKTLPQVGLREAVLVGTAQVLALFPGISRSGTTIMAGVGAGMTRHAATRFAFLLALPALLGAGVVSAPDLAEPGIYSPGDIALGVVAAFIASYLAIRFLIAFVSTERLTIFGAYCLVAGALGLLAHLLLGPVGA
jgi:undecaprenyl-diphosphatase